MKSTTHPLPTVAILAVGGTGAAVLDNLAVACEGEHRTLCIDTDALALRGTVAGKKILNGVSLSLGAFSRRPARSPA